MTRNIFDAIVSGMIGLGSTRRCPLEICKKLRCQRCSPHGDAEQLTERLVSESDISVNLWIVQGKAVRWTFPLLCLRPPSHSG
jgi:hypothetical protein